MPRLPTFPGLVLRERLARLWHRLERAPAAQGLRRASRYIQLAVLAALIGFLAFKLQAVGWAEVWAALPSDPDFYAVLLLAYSVAPLTEAAIYRRLWRLPARTLPLFFRKRVYNEVLLDYAGEAYFWAWARRSIPAADIRSTALPVVRDVNLLSGLVSNAATLLVLAAAFAAGAPLLPALPLWGLAAGVLVPFAMMLLVVCARFFSLRRADATAVAAFHTGRLVLTFLLQTALWTIALPDVPFDRWLIVLAAQMVVTRLPFLPNRELVMSGVVLTLGGVLGVSEAHVASTFMAIAALTLCLHGVVLLVTGERTRFADRPAVIVEGTR